MNEAGSDPLGVQESWRIELNGVRHRIVKSLKDEVAARGFTRVALGLSGGLDSTVTAALCVEALGAENVLGVLMPTRITDTTSLSLAQGVINSLGITSRRVNMSPVLDSYFANFPDANRNRRGIFLAWARIGALLDLGSNYGAGVVQNINRTDRMLVYGEAQQELVNSIKPLGDLYKTQVRLLADLLEVLPEVRRRRPSLEYWAGQSDEGDLGHAYSEIDPVLEVLYGRSLSPASATQRGFPPAVVEWATKKVDRSRWAPPDEAPIRQPQA
jgi:NAD+ synthase